MNNIEEYEKYKTNNDDKVVSIDKSTKRKNVHEGHRKRLRDKCRKFGLDVLEDHEVLELLLFYCIPYRDTNEIAHKMLEEFGSLHNLFDSSVEEISRRCKVSENTAVLLSMVPALIKRYSISKWSDRPLLDSPKKACEYVKYLFSGETTECFYLICLDIHSRLIFPALVSRGTVSEAHIIPRQIVEIALKYNASNVILVHNHPGGSPKPSKNDIDATKLIINTFDPLEISVIDHIIVAGNDCVSMAKNRLLKLEYNEMAD